jgi:hypothetical protein
LRGLPLRHEDTKNRYMEFEKTSEREEAVATKIVDAERHKVDYFVILVTLCLCGREGFRNG